MKLWIGLALIAAGLIFFTTTSKQRSPVVDTGMNPGTLAVPKNGNVTSTPVIVELFTSEGCSSCPPADEVLATLDKAQPVPGAEIIALGEHVDYWNKLGWIDPYSSADCSQRQSSYASAFGSDSVYTPQMIVDGRDEFSGGNMSKARDAIAKAARLPKANIQLLASSGSKANEIQVSINISDLPRPSSGDRSDVVLAVSENNLHSEVPRGENAGQFLRHSAVVRKLTVLGQIKSDSNPFHAQPVVRLLDRWKRDDLRAVVFVQERSSRRIVSAAALGLSGRLEGSAP